jgi:hypothetical protein
MNSLTKSNCYTLRTLGRISRGEETFLNVIDADKLVEIGLAERFGKGQYVLTAKGEETLSHLEAGLMRT